MQVKLQQPIVSDVRLQCAIKRMVANSAITPVLDVLLIEELFGILTL